MNNLCHMETDGFITYMGGEARPITGERRKEGGPVFFGAGKGYPATVASGFSKVVPSYSKGVAPGGVGKPFGKGFGGGFGKPFGKGFGKGFGKPFGKFPFFV